MWKRIECLAIYTENLEKSVTFYQSMGLTKAWETYQDEQEKWKLVGMRFPGGDAELVLKNNPNVTFAETEIMVEDVRDFYERFRSNPEIKWIRTPFPNALGGHVAVMKSPEDTIFVILGS
ncbi:VOC family protein [Rossellomorea sp. SC111]|uniref:VOC family protein n=1 Tax=Rossellomorea sp. SC111 TaxID=2968985 RepID=UPI00215AE1FE|nr:VOC family protein [Rossellomorea sp. SC111]MCR8848083.1 VOC family protein [Rossellomorea sp. SC111]